MEPALHKAALNDLRALTKVAGGAARWSNLRDHQGLAQVVFGALGVEIPSDGDHRAVVLSEALSGFVAGARESAIRRLGAAIWEEDPQFQIAAAAELLGITNDEEYAMAVEQYASNQGKGPDDRLCDADRSGPVCGFLRVIGQRESRKLEMSSCWSSSMS
jgi:hypothetical protein